MNSQFTNSLCVFVGGGLGAVARYLSTVVWRLVAIRFGIDPVVFPWPTLVVNILGCVFIGYFYHISAAWGLSSEMRLLLTTGFCGGLTTFSTFSFEVVGLYHQGYSVLAFIYVLVSILLGILCAAVPLLKFGA